MNKVKEGDILVAPMTSPWCLPAMERASAIVTDEGGITCHAAIVAREAGVPYIAGTQFASKKLKNNMQIVMDAGQGKVYEA